MSKSRKETSAWATQADRIKWLVETRFKNNRSAMAKAIGFSHVIVGRVVAGEANPGPQFREAVVRTLNVNPAWLERGEGRPFPDESGTDGFVPLAGDPLPGPPVAHRSLIIDHLAVPAVVPSPSVYWLELKKSQPIVAKAVMGFRARDQLLMETDPARFPRAGGLSGELCVIRRGADHLLAVLHHRRADPDSGHERLEADFFDPVQVERTVVEHVYRHLPDGRLEHFERSYTAAPNPRRTLEPELPEVRSGDIVAVWLKITRRPFL